MKTCHLGLLMTRTLVADKILRACYDHNQTGTEKTKGENWRRHNLHGRRKRQHNNKERTTKTSIASYQTNP